MGKDRTTVEIDDIIKIKLKRMGFKISPLFREFCYKIVGEIEKEDIDIFAKYDKRDELLKNKKELDDEIVKINCEILAYEAKAKKRKIEENKRAKKEVDSLKASGILGEL